MLYISRLLSPGSSWLIIVSASFLICFSSLPVAIWSARRLNLLVPPNDHSSNSMPTPLLGGAPIAIASLSTLVWFSLLPLWLGLGAIGLFIIGLWDDARPLTPMRKLAAQAVVVALAVILWSPALAGLPRWLSAVAMVLWLLSTVNGFNLVDGLDGLAGGIGLIAALGIALIGRIHHDPISLGQALAVAGAFAAFLCFNFPPASIYMGDAGALPLGFVLGALAVNSALRAGSAGVTGYVVPALIMLSPLLDMAIVSISRMAVDRDVTQRGFDHSHHKLLTLGLPERAAVVVCWTIAALAVCCAVALTVIPEADALMALPFIVLFFGLVALFMVDLTFDRTEAGAAQEQLGLMARLIRNFGYKRRLAEATLDLSLITAAYFGAFLIRFDFAVTHDLVLEILPNLPFLFVASYPVFFAFGIYRGIWRYTGLSDVARLANAAVSAGIVVMLLSYVVPLMVSGSILVLFVLILFNLLVASRLSFRVLRRGITVLAQPIRRILIIGAGETAEAAARFVAFHRDPGIKLIGFIDLTADNFKTRRLIHGSPVLGTLDQLEKIRTQFDYNELLMADGTIGAHQMSRLENFAGANQIKLLNFSIGMAPLKRDLDLLAADSSQEYLLNETSSSKTAMA